MATGRQTELQDASDFIICVIGMEQIINKKLSYRLETGRQQCISLYHRNDLQLRLISLAYVR